MKKTLLSILARLRPAFLVEGALFCAGSALLLIGLLTLSPNPTLVGLGCIVLVLSFDQQLRAGLANAAREFLAAFHRLF